MEAGMQYVYIQRIQQEYKDLAFLPVFRVLNNPGAYIRISGAVQPDRKGKHPKRRRHRYTSGSTHHTSYAHLTNKF